MGVTAIDILETIRDEAGELYQSRIPEYTRDNLQQVGQAITADDNLMNEFITSIVGKIALSNVKSKMFKNPLARLKSAGVPYGQAIEELFVNPSTDMGYSTDPATLLTQTKPDGKTAYYAVNRQGKYPVSIREEQLMQAFRSEQDFMNFYNGILSQMYSGDNIDEFMLMKALFGKAIDAGALNIIDADITQPKEVAKALSNMSSYFNFPSTNFASYNKVNASKITAGEKPCITFCETKDQCLLIRSDVQTEINYEVLATMFNMQLAEIKAMTILVDEFPCTTYDVYAVLCDKEAIQVRDTVFKIASQQIGSILGVNYWLHHWQFMFLSMFGNMVALGKPIVEEPVEEPVVPEE